MQILHAVMFQVCRGAYILLRLLAVTENQGDSVASGRDPTGSRLCVS